MVEDWILGGANGPGATGTGHAGFHACARLTKCTLHGCTESAALHPGLRIAAVAQILWGGVYPAMADVKPAPQSTHPGALPSTVPLAPGRPRAFAPLHPAS